MTASIEPGRTLLHYRIVDKLGEGGMGVVWRAEDTTLGRAVAIKVLPPVVVSPDASPAALEERLARFEREARLLGSLNHPNIATVHGLHDLPSTDPGEAGTRFIVMELVEGEDLTARLRSGRLPVEDALRIARQVAAALAAAHDSGVVHRDLKPANIRIAADDTVKVLDFGLAKAFDPSTTSGSPDPSLSPTLTSVGSRAGMILGTAAYMSPEQARGKPVDRRADTWAFGCVLYEMLTGRQAFEGETVTDVLAAILTREPDLSSLRGTVPRRLVRLIERCLEKNAGDRLRDAGDIGLELDAIRSGDDAEVERGDEPGSSRGGWLRLAAVAVGAVAVYAALAHVMGLGGDDAPPAEPRRLSITSGDERPIREASVSRGGDFVVITLDDGSYVRRLDSYELLPIPESRMMAGWVESPDGQSIAYFTIDDRILGSGSLRRLSLATGTAVQVVHANEILQPIAWRDEGIVVANSRRSAVRLLDTATGELTLLYEAQGGHFDGSVAVPGTNAMLAIFHARGDETRSLDLVDYEAGEQRQLVSNVTDATVTPTGHVVFQRDSTLLAQRFDAETLTVSGPAEPVLDGVKSFSLADNGTLVYVPAGEVAELDRVIELGPDDVPSVILEGDVLHVRYSPDGRWVSVVQGDSVRLVDRRNGAVRPLTNRGYSFSDHVWRADGRAVIYTAYSRDNDRGVLFEHPLDGGEPRALHEVDANVEEIYPTGYAPDGSGLIVALYKKRDTDLLWLPADGSGPRELLATTASEDIGRFSPDGALIAYESNESGRQEVWVGVFRPAGPGIAETWQISQSGGRDPIWSPDGATLYYEDFDDRLMTVEVRRGGDGLPIFGDHAVRLDLRETGKADGDQSYDVAPEGDRILLHEAGSPGIPEARVVFDWFRELERLVPR